MCKLADVISYTVFIFTVLEGWLIYDCETVAAAGQQPTLCTHTLWLSGWLTDNTVLSVFNVNAVYHT